LLTYDAEFIVGAELGQVRAGVAQLALLNHFNFDFTQNERSLTPDLHNEDLVSSPCLIKM
jgi:hypothetical protein